MYDWDTTMIYTLTYNKIYFIIVSGIILWTILWSCFRRYRKFWIIFNVIVFLIILYLVLRYTVLYRTPSNDHQFMFFAPFNSEFYRELLMNVLLFYPLGLTLTVLIGPWSILVAFILSFGIESWQYIAGTGVAQVSDVLMNTLGCAIGAVPYLIRFFLKKVLKKQVWGIIAGFMPSIIWVGCFTTRYSIDYFKKILTI